MELKELLERIEDELKLKNYSKKTIKSSIKINLKIITLGSFACYFYNYNYGYSSDNISFYFYPALR